MAASRDEVAALDSRTRANVEEVIETIREARHALPAELRRVLESIARCPPLV